MTMGNPRVAEQPFSRPFPNDLHLRPGGTVVRYSGRYRDLFPIPLVYLGTCACPERCRVVGRPERYDRLALAEYAGGPVELLHVHPDHVGAVRQSEYAHLLGADQ